uniref:Thiazole synthase n=1 Tax=Gelidium kathyanniae TaxID=2483893 RepID=A0A3G2QY00_9FLOR|nr:thiamin biosynthesis protein G [Gelidium kathyanniae]AYO27964.1 thiamin biosynthesis protein G [Gelidium kathyanniae]
MTIELFSLLRSFDKPLNIGSKSFNSRLMLGTGKFKDLQQTQASINMSSADIVTVAVRRAKHAKYIGKSNLIDGLNWKKLWLLPNTAGCTTAEEAIKIAYLGREMAKRIGQLDNNFVKLEVISDPKYLLPDPLGTLKAAEYLVNNGFTVLPYINSDPILAKHLEDIGCSAIMPLGSPIGSGQGLQNIQNLQIIIENTKVPVIIDAGIGTASEASRAMEIGASAVLLNTAVAKASFPYLMAEAMNLGVLSGRMAYLAGRMSLQDKALPSSPLQDIIYS